MAKAYEPTSHEAIDHDAIESLGYDWTQVADPGVAPRPPSKVYLPRSTEDVVAAVLECRSLGQRLTLRGNGHSSNDLVLTDGPVMVMSLLDDVTVDVAAKTATLGPGAITAQVDALLSESGLGLPVIGDHNHITAAGFASVGGISPASHVYGLFIDTVAALEYVDWDGQVHSCSRTERSEDFFRLLAGTGRHGVITSLTVSVIEVDKWSTVVENRRFFTRDLDRFIEHSGRLIRDPGGARMERGVWADLALGSRSVCVGQFSSYHDTEQSRAKTIRNTIAYSVQQKLGYWAGRLPDRVDRIAKYVGMSTVLVPPVYGTIKNVERFTDQVIDSTVGDPTRMLIVLAPMESYETLFRGLYDLCRRERDQAASITFISVYVKAIHSDYLAQDSPGRQFCELMLFLGLDPEKMTEQRLSAFVEEMDDQTIAARGFRYMHSRTTRDPQRRALVDPNTHYAGDGVQIPQPRVTAAESPAAAGTVR
jgi:hypothetical protein